MTSASKLFSKDWKIVLAERKKFVAYLGVVALAGLDYGVIPNSAKGWVLLGVLALGGGAVHQVENAPTQPD